MVPVFKYSIVYSLSLSHTPSLTCSLTHTHTHIHTTHTRTHSHTHTFIPICTHTPHTAAITGILEVKRSDNTIITVLGCMESFLCEGEGTDIDWRFFGTRTVLRNTTNRRITVSSHSLSHSLSPHTHTHTHTATGRHLFCCMASLLPI